MFYAFHQQIDILNILINLLLNYSIINSFYEKIETY